MSTKHEKGESNQGLMRTCADFVTAKDVLSVLLMGTFTFLVVSVSLWQREAKIKQICEQGSISALTKISIPLSLNTLIITVANKMPPVRDYSLT